MIIRENDLECHGVHVFTVFLSLFVFSFATFSPSLSLLLIAHLPTPPLQNLCIKVLPFTLNKKPEPKSAKKKKKAPAFS
ncbi:hypothetical protein RIF29_42328 [Crotalaria pallida]|uniref:Uncharacterized protein n=1 Tax=Crotalaria pallida TaxID=3830 RepID=A0AAN9E7D6_CROPI